MDVRNTVAGEDVSDHEVREILLRLALLAVCLAGLAASCAVTLLRERPARAAAAPVKARNELDRLVLSMPLPRLSRRSLRDSFAETRGRARVHNAMDILAPRGTAVLAIDDGRIVKLFTSRSGGISVYQLDRKETYCYYYAHLDGYARGLKEGRVIRRGERLGYVGTTGNARAGAPHLHLAIFKLGPEKRWWEGTPVNPYPVLVAMTHGTGS